ncbi:hypothetical protein AID11_12315 [Salmonella enterica subsp. enterica]|nr:hypothetical protein [Salmonella enterica subsp. enterica serovar Poona]
MAPVQVGSRLIFHLLIFPVILSRFTEERVIFLRVRLIFFMVVVIILFCMMLKKILLRILLQRSLTPHNLRLWVIHISVMMFLRVTRLIV